MGGGGLYLYQESETQKEPHMTIDEVLRTYRLIRIHDLEIVLDISRSDAIQLVHELARAGKIARGSKGDWKPIRQP